MSTLSELHPFLEQIRRRPNKNLSQNFLVDPNISRKMAELAQVGSESVLEIGPGAGALTCQLLKKGAKLFAIEKDPILGTALREKLAEERLTLTCCDFLDFDLSQLLPFAPFKVVANLPYHITTPIFEKLLEHRHLFSTFTLMIQEEVAARILAKPGSNTYSSFSLFLKFHTEVITSFKVPPFFLFPRPKVFSKVVHLSLKTPPLTEEKELFALIRVGFQMRRKMLRSSLQSIYPAKLIMQAMERAKLSPQARPEELSLEEWIALFQACKAGFTC